MLTMYKMYKKTYRLAIVILLSTIACTLAYVHITTAQTSPLATLVASLASGAWAPLATGNINSTLVSTGSDGHVFGYTEDITYDPTSQKFLYIGSDHNATSQFIIYDSIANAWAVQPRPSWLPQPTDYLNGTMHGYDHSAIDPIRGFFYHRPVGTFNVHRYNIATQTWDSPAVPTRSSTSPFGNYPNCCDALEYFPELGGVVWVAGDQTSPNAGHVYLLSDSGNQWSVLSSTVDLAGTWQTARYNPVYKVLIFYSSQTNKFYKLDSARNITTIANPPFAMYDGSSYVATLTVDPLSGQYLALSASSRQFYIYDVPTNIWQALPSINKPNLTGQAVVAAPVSSYGVTFFTACKPAGAGCQVYLYKHQPVVVVPPPPDTTAPTVSLSAPASGATVSGTVSVSANASDNVGVVGVQFKLDGVNLGLEDTISPYSLSWATTSTTNGTHTLSATARDAAGNQTTSTAITVTVDNSAAPPPPPASGTDFATRCAAAGVVRCVGFDSNADLGVTDWTAVGSNSGNFNNAGICNSSAVIQCPTIDGTTTASGSGSLKFIVPSQSGAGASGQWFTNFSPDLATQFGQGEEFYIQWRQRFSPEYLNTTFQGGGGWKQFIVGEGDRPGATAQSCTQIDVVVQNTNQRGFPQVYHSCGGKDGQYQPLEQGFGGDILMQNARPSPYCLYTQGVTVPKTYFPPSGNCFGYFPNEWMTFQIHVKAGTWYLNDGNYHRDSTVELWVGREGQTSQLVDSYTTYDLANNNPAAEYGKLWLLPYHTGKDATQVHPTGYVWYDDLIISRNKIADPAGGTTPPPSPADTTAPVLSNITATSTTSTGATITWLSDEASDSQVEYGLTTAYGSTTPLSSSQVTSHSLILSGLSAQTTYNYRVSSRDASGNLATSSNFTFTTAASTGPSPPSPPPPPSSGGLIGYWKLDEGSGTLASDSAGSNNGTLSNGAIWAAGRVGNAIRFNASDNGIDDDDPIVVIGRNFNVSLPFTISAWVNPTDYTDWRGIFSKRDDASFSAMRFELGLTAGTGQVFIFTPTFTNFAYAPPVNTWTNLTVVATSTGTQLYVNGALQQTMGPLALGSGANANTVIGGTGEGPGGDNDPFKGLIDEVRVYSSALSDTEIQDVYNYTVASAPPPPDTTVPTVSMTAPSSGATVSGSITVSATASDNVGVVGVQFQLDGISIGSEMTSAPYTISWNATAVPAGSHLLSAVARDANGNSATSASITVIVPPPPDTTAPSVSITAPAPGATVSGTAVPVSAIASDNVGVVGVQFQLDGVNIGAEDTVAPYSISWNTTAVSIGSHSLTAIARDASGNTASSSISVIVPDTTAPTVSMTAPASGTTVGATVTVSASASDNVGVVGVQFKLDGANLGAEDTSFPYSISWNTTAVSAGSHTLKAVARDAAGNTTTSSSITVIVPDTTAPTVSITAPLSGATVGTTVTVSANASDNVGVVGVQFQLDGSNIGAEDTSAPYSISWNTTLVSAGSHSLTAVARDAAGNTATSSSITVIVPDITAPTVSVTSPNSGTIVGTTVTVSASASDNVGVVGVQFQLDGSNIGAEDTSAPYSISWSTTSVSAGSHALTAVARDAAGNTATSSSIIVIVPDTTAPTVSVTSPALNATVGATVTVSASASDNVGVAGVQFRLDGTNIGAEDTIAPYFISWNTSTVSPGPHTLTAVARDAAGNTTTSLGINVIVQLNADTSAATVSITAPASGTTVGATVTVSASASDNVGVVGVQFQVDGSNIGAEDTVAPFSVSWNTTSVSPGSHFLTAIARDAAGNTSTSSIVTVLVADTTAPTVSVTAPTSGSVVSGTAVTVSASASDDVGVVGVQFRLDGFNIGAEDTVAPYSISWNSNTVSAGSHTLTAVARDAAGNTTTSSGIAVIVPDTTAPTVSITSPASGSTVSGTAVTVSASASDNVGVATVQFQLDGVNLGAEMTSAPYSISWNTTMVSAGTHSLTAIARDAAGNTAASLSVSVIVPPLADTIAPLVSLTAPGPGASVSGIAVTVSATASDNVGVVGVQFKVDGTNIGEEVTVVPYSISWNTKLVSNGSHTLTAVARDAAGNTATSTDITVFVTNTIKEDFDGDGKSDLVFFNTQSGNLTIWLMNGNSVVRQSLVAQALNLSWRISGIGDLDGDGRADILWRDTKTGDVIAWLMDGTSVKATATIASKLDLSWQVSGVGDLDGDGKDDILWRNMQTGDVTEWLMNGTSKKSTTMLVPGLYLGWQIAGIGDLDGDGKDDIVWRDMHDGDVAEWLMDGPIVKSWSTLGIGIYLGWQIAGIGDLDGDAKSDIIWRSAQGGVAEWLMNGPVVKSWSVLDTVVGTDWVIRNTADYDGDERVDIVWKNTQTGELVGWMMDGSVVKSSARISSTSP